MPDAVPPLEGAGGGTAPEGEVPGRGQESVTSAAGVVPDTDGVPAVSVVIPVYNEEENLPELHSRLTSVLADVDSYEIIYVDDGSRDSSARLVRDFHRADPRVHLLRFTRNFGHQAAINAGLDSAAGDAVIFMDADLQDPPELLITLIRHWQDGADVVYAVRAHRKGNIVKRCAYWLFYRLFRALANIDVPLDAGDFGLIDRQVADAIRSLPERNRLLRGLRTWVGFTQVGVPYDRPDRFAGEPKYRFRSLLRLALDGLLSFSEVPLRLASLLGFVTAFLGVLYVLYAFISRVASGAVPEGWTSIIAIVLTLGGVQLIVLGIIGEYLARVYTETKGRPVYLVQERLDGRSPARGERRQILAAESAPLESAATPQATSRSVAAGVDGTTA